MTNGWRRIATAPKDGTRLLVFEPDRGDEGMYVTSWETFRDGFGDKYTGWVSPDIGELGPTLMSPTHWMHLPKEPQ